ncbi:MAG TPA: DUF805 domain-containing protein [Sphingomonas sp.]|jgi:uncharacterized membrane protein YhaH (DUF805 family)|nr:DUF805 domain-containing protein [Sphingomonas sp.]
MRWMIMPLRRYADFRGRSQRIELWMWILFQIVLFAILVTLDNVLGLGGHHRTGVAPGSTALSYTYGFYVSGGLLTWVFFLLALIPNLAVHVRRLHDSDRTGWWVVMPIAPFVFTLALGVIAVASRSLTMLLVTALFWILSFGGIIWLIVLQCLDGTRGENRFGPDPRDPDAGRDLSEVFG